MGTNKQNTGEYTDILVQHNKILNFRTIFSFLGHEGYGRGGMERDNYPHAEGDNVSKYDRTSTSNSQEFSR